MDQRIIDLYDDYTHRHLDRRLFIQRAAKILGSVAAANAALPLLAPNYALAAKVDEEDKRLNAGPVSFAGKAGPVKGYVARPVGTKKLPGVIVIHENRGLNPHIKDVARRVALAGYVALAPDLMSRIGGTPATVEEAAANFPKVDPAVEVEDLQSAADYLLARPDASGKLGTMGFCWGGGMTLRFVQAEPRLSASSTYYGPVSVLDGVSKIKAKMLLNYAGQDANVNPKLPDLEAALKGAKVDYKLHVYPGVQHAFNNDTSAERYNEAAAKLAWDRTMALFKANLRG